MKRYFIPFLLLILILTSGVLVGCGQAQPPYFKALGERVHLINNSRAYDHVWNEVWNFLVQDTTDKEAWTPEHTCGFFAEELHNRSEYYGFKTAFVVVEFETGEPHALNAFNTVDYGLVYVDCTGPGRFGTAIPTGGLAELPPVTYWDKVTYIEEGRNMGFISLGYEEQNFSYDWYEKCRTKLARFEADLRKYNEKDEQYNGEEDFCTQEWWEKRYPGRGAELYKYYQERLQYYLYEERNRLRTEWEKVRGYTWEESESPVTKVKLYW